MFLNNFNSTFSSNGDASAISGLQDNEQNSKSYESSCSRDLSYVNAVRSSLSVSQHLRKLIPLPYFSLSVCAVADWVCDR